MCATYNTFLIPLTLSFRPQYFEQHVFNVAENVIDFIFLVDIFITFRLVYIDSLGNEETDWKRIAINYLSGVFWIDLLATLPLDTIF